MHDDCLQHDALMRVYERLGKDKPQTFEQAASDIDEKKEVLPPSETDGSQENETEKPENKLPTYIAPPSAASTFPASRKKGLKREPYRGLFDANLRLGDGMTAWHIKDLRENVEGGVKEWYEQVFCLFCDRLVD